VYDVRRLNFVALSYVTDGHALSIMGNGGIIFHLTNSSNLHVRIADCTMFRSTNLLFTHGIKFIQSLVKTFTHITYKMSIDEYHQRCESSVTIVMHINKLCPPPNNRLHPLFIWRQCYPSISRLILLLSLAKHLCARIEINVSISKH
jgi:hypothetical protein